ncbi:hypothetical protein KIN20_031568 [Parelaphostrongylus tenuis]|uniref:SCP domain-containing protein n=1 Tax=Parelaphostrongylus tenuis TaxID=148309 RepID=A0AAD5WHQ8_PARTN|nr:hypothetical protein KIN20_031568 [Parelaphostrongylus tenuis]
MAMNTYFAAFILAAIVLAEEFGSSASEDSKHSDSCLDGIGDLVADTTYDNPDCKNDFYAHPVDFWFQISDLHNKLRATLQYGDEQNESESEANKFPKSSDMSYLRYNCTLEEEAFNISRMCLNTSDPNFLYVGSNNATISSSEDVNIKLIFNASIADNSILHGDDYVRFYDILEQKVQEWWDTSKIFSPLVNLTPTAENKPMIPFLQMANANMTSLGCAYSLCDPCGSPFVSFVCRYGGELINIGKPIYTKGNPCDTCRESCDDYKLCKRTI